MKKILGSFISFLLVSSYFSTAVYAVSTPSFPACANPQGVISVSYSDGIHGIVGSTATYTGRDTVYKLSDETTTQCYCSTDGQGIQTNWWKASSLTDEQIEILKADGWYYVPAGNLWGLDASPYVAKNISYTCLSGSSSNSSSNSSSSQSSDNGIGGGDVLGVSEGEVLGLAATGDSILVYGSFALGMILLLVGIARFKKQA